MQRLHALKKLTFGTSEHIINLVQRVQNESLERHLRRVSAVFGADQRLEWAEEACRNVSSVTFAGVRGISRAVEALTELPFALVSVAQTTAPTDPPGAAPETGSYGAGGAQDYGTLLSWLNGAFGDYLRRTGNALDLGLGIWHDGRPLALSRESLSNALPQASSKVAVFVHGLCCTERAWTARAEDLWGHPDISFGSKLRDELGYTPLYVRYNSGVHVSENGNRLSELLAELVDAYPCELESIILIGHSMGGLVARSAAHCGEAARQRWVSRLKGVFCLASPHLGAPLEKGTNLVCGLLGKVDSAASLAVVEVLKARSSGIKDLRFGYTSKEEWRDLDPDAVLVDRRRNFPRVQGVSYGFISATVTRDPQHPMGRLIGDLIVRRHSASGIDRDESRCIPFQLGATFGGITHFALLNHPEAYAQIKAWCRQLP